MPNVSTKLNLNDLYRNLPGYNGVKINRSNSKQSAGGTTKILDFSLPSEKLAYLDSIDDSAAESA